MDSALLENFHVSLAESELFSSLSGDFNPLHIDPVSARRTPFGGTVAHGIHLFLRALDGLAAKNLLDGREPAALSASFNSPVPSGTPVTLRAEADGSAMRFTAWVGQSQAFSGRLSFTPALRDRNALDTGGFDAASPIENPFPPARSEGSVRLKLNPQVLGQLFPALARTSACGWIADLLATTQIVGMECPGLHSIYSAFRLRRVPQRIASEMTYRVDGVESRFHLLRMQVMGACLQGTVETFFRPRPVAQLSMEQVLERVSRGPGVGHSALVVGGSRGLGELTAKIAAAAGAEVTITFARGSQDAERVRDEIVAAGGRCSANRLDAATCGTDAAPEWLRRSDFSHVYYFASPPISRSDGPWNETLFHRFAQAYVTAFEGLVRQTLAARRDPNRPVRFLYPSSVLIEQPEAGFAEYAVAKAAGEALCDQLHGRRGAWFAKPRLPRMRTDQTNALVDTRAIDPFPVMLELVRTMHSPDPPSQ